MAVDLIRIAADQLWEMIPEGCGAELTLDNRKLSIPGRGTSGLVFYFRFWKVKPGIVRAAFRTPQGYQEQVDLNIADPAFFEKAMKIVDDFLKWST